jgi:hypothetical protein
VRAAPLSACAIGAPQGNPSPPSPGSLGEPATETAAELPGAKRARTTHSDSFLAVMEKTAARELSLLLPSRSSGGAIATAFHATRHSGRHASLTSARCGFSLERAARPAARSSRRSGATPGWRCRHSARGPAWTSVTARARGGSSASAPPGRAWQLVTSSAVGSRRPLPDSKRRRSSRLVPTLTCPRTPAGARSGPP